MWQRSCDHFCKQTTFFAFPFFSWGKLVVPKYRYLFQMIPKRICRHFMHWVWYSVSKNYSPVARQAKYYRIEQISQNITWVLDNDEKNHDANTNRFCIMFLNFTPCLFRWKNMIYYFVMCILSKRDICWKIKEIFSILVLESLYCQAHRILQGWILTEIKCHSTTIYFVLLVVFLGKQVELFKLWRT